MEQPGLWLPIPALCLGGSEIGAPHTPMLGHLVGMGHREAEVHQPPPPDPRGSEGGGALQEVGSPTDQPKQLVLFLLSSSSGVICLTQVNNLLF